MAPLPQARPSRRALALVLLALGLLAQGLLLGRMTETREPYVAGAWLVGLAAVALAAAGGVLLRDAPGAPVRERLGTTDPLTRTLNRRGFMSAAAQEFTRSVRYGRPLSVLAVKVDVVNAIGHRHGLVAQDTVLERLAAAWQAELRTTDTVGRVAREAFAILLPETPADTAVELAARIRGASGRLQFDFLPAGERVSVWVGSASTEMGDSGIEHALARAEEALEPRAAGGDTVPSPST